MSGRDSRIIFAGTPAFATTCLDGLVEAGYPPIAVFTQPDRPAGRGRKLSASPVKLRALELGLPLHQPISLKGTDATEALRSLAPDLMVVVAYGLILPSQVLAIPSRGCANVHASLLPRWRGAAPIQRALMAGDARTGVCLMAMTKGLDEGPVYARIETPIDATDTSGSLHERLGSMGAELLARELPALLDGSATPVAQDGAAATYAAKITKHDAEMDWSEDATALALKVRGLAPWPIAWALGSTETEGPIRIWSATSMDSSAVAKAIAPGTVVAEDQEGIQVMTGHGILRVHRLQLPGKRPMDATEFLNGRSLLGQRLGSRAVAGT
jgi:methionyl-tRNA formyltransferase